ncbi:MAG: C39 family peptidase [Actinomycetota bacterium]|nr:C39 family peptidase [Actinomycetota bacterium]MDQ2956164.1 C39 family peptidase [Actinomycetota bacterium]
MTSSESYEGFDRFANLVAAHLSVLSALDAGPALPPGRRIDDQPTEIHDLNGELLFWRAPIIDAADSYDGDSYVDIAAHPALGAPLVALSHGVAWNPGEFVDRAQATLDRQLSTEIDEVRFVAYSFPKIAVQFLNRGNELALVELFSWLPVPQRPERLAAELPGNFERWSYLDEQPGDLRERNLRRFAQRAEGLAALADRFELRDRRIIELDRDSLIDLLRPRTDSRELHYSGRATDHATCYELRGQETNVWCVAASVQMVLDFYRYDYDQTRIASQLGLGTKANPNGLPFNRSGDTSTALQVLSNNSLASTMNTSPNFAQFRSEILANRPLVSFIPGHSRSVAGYTRTTAVLNPAVGFSGLLVFDPWPPNAGVITRWENVDSQTYVRTFDAHVTLV